jgi:hypothetical protein
MRQLLGGIMLEVIAARLENARLSKRFDFLTYLLMALLASIALAEMMGAFG